MKIFKPLLCEVEKGDKRSDVGMSNLAARFSTTLFPFYIANPLVHHYIYTDEFCRRDSTMVLS